MDQAELIEQSFWALCVNMHLKDYEEASMIATYLSCFHDSLTETQLDQLQITWYRLDHLKRMENDNETE